MQSFFFFLKSVTKRTIDRKNNVAGNIPIAIITISIFKKTFRLLNFSHISKNPPHMIYN